MKVSFGDAKKGAAEGLWQKVFPEDMKKEAADGDVKMAAAEDSEQKVSC